MKFSYACRSSNRKDIKSFKKMLSCLGSCQLSRGFEESGNQTNRLVQRFEK